MGREQDANAPDQSKNKIPPSLLERIFHTDRPASIILSDITGNLSMDPLYLRMWGLTNKYMPLFGSKGELTEKPEEDPYGPEAFEKEDEQYGDKEDSWRMRRIRRDEAEHMATFLFSPPTEPQQIMDRQQLLEQLIASEHLDELIGLKNKSYKLIEGMLNLAAYHEITSFSNKESLINLFYQGQKELPIYTGESRFFLRRIGTEPIMPIVSDAVDMITFGIRAVGDLEKAVNAQQSSLVQQMFPDLFTSIGKIRGELTNVVPFDKVPIEIKNHPYSSGAGKWIQDTLRRNVEPYLYRIGVVLEFAKKIRDEGWGKVSFDPEKPVSYKKGWNLEKKKNVQVPNDSPDDSLVVVLSGANTSGKSFTMKSDFLIRIAGQSLGFAPVQAANLRPYDNFIYLDRSASASSNDLSAFMQEIQNWKEALPLIGPHSRLYVDEGHSTTSPQGQATLLLATTKYVNRNGGSVMLATHNDMVLDAAGNNPDMQTYHLAADVGSNGELIRHFRLEPGRSESHSLTVARMKNFPQDTLSWAEGYLNRDPSLPIPLVSKNYPAIKNFTEEERGIRKREAQSLDHLFPAKPVNPVFHLLSIDSNFQIGRFFIHATHGREKKVMNFLSSERQKELLGKMVVWVPELSPAEVLERQRLIGELMKSGMQQKLHDAIQQAAELAYTFIILKRAVKEGLNQKLNPFYKDDDERGLWNINSESSNFPFSTEYLREAIAFLKIQQKVSKGNSQFTSMLNQFTTLASIHEDASKRAQENSDAKTTKLTENEKAKLFLIFDAEDKDTLTDTPTIEHLEKVAEKMFGKLSTAGKDLPTISFEDINIDEIKDELAILKKHIGTAEALEKFPENIENSQPLIALLRITDSVYLHQVANFLEQQINKNLAILNDQEEDVEEIIEGEEKEEDETIVTDESTTDDIPQQFDHIGRRSSSWIDLMSKNRMQKISPYYKTLQQLDALCLFADIAEREEFTPVQFNSTGEVEFREGFSIFKQKRGEVKNTVSLNADSERVQLLTGPNGSGKTFYEKGAVAAVLMGLATGYAPAEYATIPVFDAVVYLDRVVEKQDDELSAFSQEIEYWKQLLPLLKTKKSLFAAVDEAFSTTSPSYQAAFISGVISEFLQSPHFLLLSTHNHDVVNRLEKARMPLVNPHHFQFSTEDGKVQYQYKLQKGHETSYAVAVARTMGLPEEIIVSAERGNDQKV